MNLYYNLPRELIAQAPSEKRDEAKLLVLSRATGRINHVIFKELVNFLDERYLIVLNNTKVFPARLFGRSEGGGKVEILLVKEMEPLIWEVLARPSKRLKKGCTINFDHGHFSAIVLENTNSNNRHNLLRFDSPSPLMEILNRYGRTPLPPYIKRTSHDADTAIKPQAGVSEEFDRRRYQTVYARSTGSCACPTAGLHFTHELLNALKDKVAGIAEITLHIGPGTFRPIKTDNFEEHRMEEEYFSISQEAAGIINLARERGLNVVAVGTSTARALEEAGGSGMVSPGEGNAGIFIYPGYRFKIISSLITNFHQPESTPLALVAAFAGGELLSEAYGEAIEKKYRFLSYGDGMLII